MARVLEPVSILGTAVTLRCGSAGIAPKIQRAPERWPDARAALPPNEGIPEGGVSTRIPTSVVEEQTDADAVAGAGSGASTERETPGALPESAPLPVVKHLEPHVAVVDTEYEAANAYLLRHARGDVIPAASPNGQLMSWLRTAFLPCYVADLTEHSGKTGTLSVTLHFDQHRSLQGLVLASQGGFSKTLLACLDSAAHKIPSPVPEDTSPVVKLRVWFTNE